MKNNVMLLFLTFTIYKVSCQDKRVLLKGIIVSDSVSVENIHIINKTTKKATTSDIKGRFRILVKENDTLVFSAVQFENKLIKIQKNHVNNLNITILMKSGINKLTEVKIKKTKNIAGNLGLPNADKNPLNKIESRLNYHSKASIPRVLLGILLREKGSINDIYYITSGKREKDRKLTKLIESDNFKAYQSNQIERIRKQLKDTFFIKTLKIPKIEIDYFIKYCNSKHAVIELFSKSKDLAIIDIFIKESNTYLKKKKNEE